MIRRDADILRLDLRAPDAGVLTLADLEAVRLVLRGGSPIDWHRLNLQTLSEVDDLLRANLVDPEHPRDMSRLEYLHRESLRYLRRNFAFRFPPEVEEPADVRHLFLYASETGRMNRVQILSCVVLKTMHTINHLEARELLLETAVSEAELIQGVEDELVARARAVIADGLPVVDFYGSRKSRDSMVSKLLSKKGARASDILDRLRFRITTETRKDIVPVLAHLFRHVLPWNQVTAAQSTNNLVDFMRFLEEEREVRELRPLLQVDPQHDEDGPDRNEFSGGSYRMINFIIDVPVRLDHLLSRAGDPWMLQKGSIVYVACEFQVVDQETAFLNEQGENSHAKYKVRQREKVGQRLMWGLLRESPRRNGDRASKTAGAGLRIVRKPRSISPLSDESTLRPAPRPERRAIRPPRPGLPRLEEDDDGEDSLGPTMPLRAAGTDEDSMLEPFRLPGEDTLGFEPFDH